MHLHEFFRVGFPVFEQGSRSFILKDVKRVHLSQPPLVVSKLVAEFGQEGGLVVHYLDSHATSGLIITVGPVGNMMTFDFSG